MSTTILHHRTLGRLTLPADNDTAVQAVEDFLADVDVTLDDDSGVGIRLFDIDRIEVTR